MAEAMTALVEVTVAEVVERTVPEVVARVMDELLPNAGADPQARLLSAEEAAEHLGVSRGLIYDLLNAGELGSVRIGSRRLVPVASLVRFIAEHTRYGSDDTPVLFNNRREG